MYLIDFEERGKVVFIKLKPYNIVIIAVFDHINLPPFKWNRIGANLVCKQLHYYIYYNWYSHKSEDIYSILKPVETETNGWLFKRS